MTMMKLTDIPLLRGRILAILTLLAFWMPVPDAHAGNRERIVHKDVENSPLVSIGPGGRLVYRPYTNKGDRIMDYSFCGYKASEEPIPDVRTVLTLEPLPDTPAPVRKEYPESKPDVFLAYPDGPDSRARIQAALDQAGAMAPDEDGFRGAVLLRKGAYYLKDGLSVPAGVVLRGEGDGEDGTVLVFHHPGGTGITLANEPESQLAEGPEAVSDPESDPDEDSEPAATPEPLPVFTTRISDAYVPVASTSVTVKDAGPFKAGDHVLVIKTTNQAWIETLGMNPPAPGKKPWTPGVYQLRHHRRIAKVEGNRLTFDIPLPESIVKKHGGGEVVDELDFAPMAPRGLEKLRILSNYNRAVRKHHKRTGEEIESDEEYNLQVCVRVETRNSWVRNCTMMHFMKSAVSAGNGARFVTIRDCTTIQPVSTGRGGRNYNFSLNAGASMVLIYRCAALNGGRHAFVTGKKTLGPNAFVMCRQTHGNMEAHHRWAAGILFDKCVNTSIWGFAAQNRRGLGSGHGWAGVNTVIWNCEGGVFVENPQTPENNFAIGCIIPDYAKNSNGNVLGDGYVESTGTHVTPDSLFVQQLIDRIGKEKAMTVLELPTSFNIPADKGAENDCENRPST